jgi:phage replication-related protein YjqB (UPF0714/DUF867 family)
MPTEYQAQILKLDLPGQDTLKNDAERCSADPDMLQSIGRAVRHQVRITRTDDPRFFALYTVAQANPPADLGDPSRANVVRTGQTGRERLGKSGAMSAVVQATVVDASPGSSGVRFFEVAEDDVSKTYFVVIAPHGGDIEKGTDDEAEHLVRELAAIGCPSTTWICKGFGDAVAGASQRWHITSTDLNPASFPRLATIATRKFCHGVAFHGFAKGPDDADLYIGGGASGAIKMAIRCALEGANMPLQIRIATEADDPKFQGRSADNLINRLATQGIHIEQSSDARTFSEKIANAIATVYATPLWRFGCAETDRFLAKDNGQSAGKSDGLSPGSL